MSSKKWEYYSHVETGGDVDLPPILKKYGEMGWELIVFNTAMTTHGPQLALIFKREIIKKETT